MSQLQSDVTGEQLYNSPTHAATSSNDDAVKKNPPDFQILCVNDLIKRTNRLKEQHDDIDSLPSPSKGTYIVATDIPAAATSTPLNRTMDGGNVDRTSNGSESDINSSIKSIDLETRDIREHIRDILLDLHDHQNVIEDLDSDDGDDIFEIMQQQSEYHPVQLPQPLYPMGPLKYKECIVCLELKDLNLRTCCTMPVCDDCVLMYVTIQIQQGNVKIGCPNDSCDKYVHRDEVMTRLTGDLKEKYHKFLVDANKDPHIKTCPRCSTITKVDPSQLKNPKVKKKGLRKTCTICKLDWCFPCQAPWHEGISCKMFHKGDKLLRQWAKEQPSGQANAQKCPKCKIFIQRSSGCDHMTCTKCHVDFCYKCGERHIKIKFLGDHYSRLSIFGCKYRFLPNNPFRRKLARGSIFAIKTIMLPAVAAVAIAVGAVILGVGIFILPVWGGLKIRNHRRLKKQRKEEKMYREMWRKKLQDVRISGDPYMENFNRMRSLGHNPYRSFRNGILMADEIDMRQFSSRQQQSTQDSITSDDISVLSVNMEDNINCIKLSAANLDIHATLDTHVDIGEDMKNYQAECHSLSCDSTLESENETESAPKLKRKGGVSRHYSPVIKVYGEGRSKSIYSGTHDPNLEARNDPECAYICKENADKADVPSSENISRTDITVDKSDSFGEITDSGDGLKSEEIIIVQKAKKENNSSNNIKDPRASLKTGAKWDENKVKRLVSQYTCGLKSESNDLEDQTEDIIMASSPNDNCPPMDIKEIISADSSLSSKVVVNSGLTKVNSSKTTKKVPDSKVEQCNK